MIFLVNDANILIDLLKLNLLDTFFRLEYDFQVTDLVLSEVQEENVNQLTRYLKNSLLKQQAFAFTELGEIGALNEEHPALSIPDCSCLYLAEKLEATLLTGDGALRRIANQRSIPVRGMLWFLDETLACGLITRTEARNKLEQLMELNHRLPVKECKKRFHD